jgi:hypothetical protein
LTKIRFILKDYPLNNIYNIDKTALYWKSSLNNSLIFKKLKGGKADKLRITANFCYNADGSYKLNIFFIVKALRLRAFKGIRYIKSLGY